MELVPMVPPVAQVRPVPQEYTSEAIGCPEVRVVPEEMEPAVAAVAAAAQARAEPFVWMEQDPAVAAVAAVAKEAPVVQEDSEEALHLPYTYLITEQTDDLMTVM